MSASSVYNSRSYKSTIQYHATIPSIHLIRKIQEPARFSLSLLKDLSRSLVLRMLRCLFTIAFCQKRREDEQVWPSSPSKNWPLDWLSKDCLSPFSRLIPRGTSDRHLFSCLSTFHIGGAFRAVERQAHAVCDYVIRANATTAGGAGGGSGGGETMMNRWSGFFSTSSTAWRVWPAPCSFTFPVQPGQSVQINLLTFNITYVH